MTAASANVEQQQDNSFTFEPVGKEKKLEMCCCEEERCLLGKGAYGSVFLGKWKADIISDAEKTIDVAVKVPNGPYHVKYEIDTLEKVNQHRNILRFYGEINNRLPPSRYDDL